MSFKQFVNENKTLMGITAGTLAIALMVYEKPEVVKQIINWNMTDWGELDYRKRMEIPQSKEKPIVNYIVHEQNAPSIIPLQGF